MSALRWSLLEPMAARGIRSAAELRRRLGAKRILLSESQVQRLVKGEPDSAKLELLAALCDVLGVELDRILIRKIDGAAAVPTPSLSAVPSLRSPAPSSESDASRRPSRPAPPPRVRFT